MRADPSHAADYWTLVVPMIFIGVAVLRNLRTRNLRIERLWIAPAMILLATALAFSQQRPPGPLMIGIDATALVVGVALGWWRARFTTITVNPDTHDLTSRASPVGMLVILGIFALRMGLRTLATQNAGALHVSVGEIADSFLLMAVGLVCAQRLELALRATRLLTEARRARAAAQAR